MHLRKYKRMINKNKYYFLINSLESWWAERVTINFSNNLIKEWKDVYIITLKANIFYDIPKWVKHIKLSNIKNNFLMFLLTPRYCFKFKRVVKKYNLGEWMSLLEISNFIHVLSKKNPTISFRTNILAFRWLFGKIYKILIKILYPKAKKIIVNSAENRYDLAEFLDISKNKIEIIYNPIDKQKLNKLKLEKIWSEISKKLKWKKIFITVGSLRSLKHHNKIISGLKWVYDNIYKERIYLIIWDWPEKKNLKNLVAKLWLEKNIIFLWKQKNVFKYLNIADTFLYASEVEWFPNVLLEAKELWLPIITSDFKSWAKEIIIGGYSKNIWNNIQYPYQGRYWYLLNINIYEKQLTNLLKQKFNK